MKRILGIDPGSLNLGFGLVSCSEGRIVHLDHGILRFPKTQVFHKRLGLLLTDLQLLLARLQPDIVAVEKIFLGKNIQSAFQLGHARGVCLAEAARLGIEVVEYSPREVKQGVTGNGAASKELVCHFMQNLLRIDLESAGGLDASDALALAYHQAARGQSPLSVLRSRGVTL